MKVFMVSSQAELEFNIELVLGENWADGDWS